MTRSRPRLNGTTLIIGFNLINEFSKTVIGLSLVWNFNVAMYYDKIYKPSPSYHVLP